MPYAYERYDVAPNPAYGYVLGAAIAKGRILSIDATAALVLQGVLAVSRLRTPASSARLDQCGSVARRPPGLPPGDRLGRRQSFEQAWAAAALVEVTYEHSEGSFDLASVTDAAVTPKTIKPESMVGDFETAFAAAPVQLDETYTTPDHAHAMMEPHASTAVWNGDQLTVWT